MVAYQHEELSCGSVSDVFVDHFLDRLNELNGHPMGELLEQLRHLAKEHYINVDIKNRQVACSGE